MELEEKKSAGMGQRAGSMVEEGAVRRKLIFHDTQNWKFWQFECLRWRRHSRAGPGLHRTTEKSSRAALERLEVEKSLEI